MHQRTREILEHLDGHRAGLRAAIALIPSELYARRPAQDRWAAVEIVQHLGLVETRISSLVVSQLDHARAAGLGPERETTSILGTLDVAALLDRSRPRIATEAARPRGDVSMAAAWSVLDDARGTLRAALLSADGLALGEVIAPHPLLGPLNMYQWLIFAGAHEGRHAAQMREVAAALAVSAG